MRAGAIAATVLAAAALSAAASPPTAQARSCGVAGQRGERFAVFVERGRVRCALARRVMRIYFAGGGVHHDGRSLADSYVVIGRWSCGSGTGGGGCIRGGSDYTNARDRIAGVFCRQVAAPRACRRRR